MKFITVFLFLNFVGESKAFDWQAHRGYRGHYPENTILAMQEALKLPISTLEFDVVISKDHQIVVSHEPWMSEQICLGAKGKEFNLYKMNYQEIAKFDCGSKAHPKFKKQNKVIAHKPKMSDLLKVIEEQIRKNNRKLFYSIEIKSTIEDENAGYQPTVELFTDLVINEIEKNLAHDRYCIQSFDWRVLDYLSIKYPKVQRVALIENKYEVKTVLKKLKKIPQVFSPYFKHLTKTDVDYLHSQNIKVIPWTVNTAKEIEEVKKLGVDGLITDYPNLIN